MLLPLLIQGFDQLAVAANGNGFADYVTTKNRGNVKAIDVVHNDIVSTSGTALVNVSVGGEEIIDSVSLGAFNSESFPRTYKRNFVNISGGQSLSFNVDNRLFATPVNPQLQVLHENPFMTEAFQALLYDDHLGLKQAGFTFDVAAGAKGEQLDIVPTKRGEVIAIQPVCFAASSKVVELTTMSVIVDGVRIIDNIIAPSFYQFSTRLMQFPIHIPQSASIKIEADNGSAGANTLGVILYFAPEDKTMQALKSVY